jgi:MauM/NapG family ferredoxin protein
MSDAHDPTPEFHKVYTRAELLRKGLRLAGGMVVDKIDRRIPDIVKHVRTPIYPPGAVSNFKAKCTSCGDCVEACPEDALQALPGGADAKLLPVLTPARAACIMCEDTPCISACDDGALLLPEDGTFPAMGTAVIDHSTCLAYNGSTCYACYDACPLKRQAISLRATRPEMDESVCTGCGLCEHACVTDAPKAIRVTGLLPGATNTS